MNLINDYIHEKISQLTTVSVDSHDLFLHSHFMGSVCARKVWLNLHSHRSPAISYQRHRVQKHREREAGFLIDELIKIGFDVHALHPKTKTPIHFLKEGLSVRMSGIAKASPQQVESFFPEGWFLVQVEHIKADLLEKICCDGLQSVYSALWHHCLLGMGYSRVHHCLVYLSADNGTTYAEFLHFNEDLYHQLRDLAGHFFSVPDPPPRLDPELCGNCYQRPVCHDPIHVPEVSCYTCHYHQIRDQAIFCKRYDRLMEEDVWPEGCQEHLFLSGLINFAKKVAEETMDNGAMVMIYELETGIRFSNCGNKTPRQGLMFSSREISVGGPLALSDPTVRAVKIHFEGSKIIAS